jgi:hypothetical protein
MIKNGFDLSESLVVQVRSGIDTDGFAYIENCIPAALLADLKKECLNARKQAKRAESDIHIAYRSSLAQLGSMGTSLLQRQAVLEILKPIFGKDYEYRADASCYTFFEEGDFLSPHMDRHENCEVTLLFYIVASEPGPDPDTSGLYLSLYSKEDSGKIFLKKTISTPSGGIMVGRGSQVLHGRRVLGHGEYIWMLTACFSPTKPSAQ